MQVLRFRRADRSTVAKVVTKTHSTTDSTVRGITWTMPAIANLNIAEGRSLTESEDEHSAHVAIIGTTSSTTSSAPATRSEGDPRRRHPLHRNRVAESQGKTMGSSMDNWVASSHLVPPSIRLHSTLRSMWMRGWRRMMENLIDQLRIIMRRRHLLPHLRRLLD